MTEDLGITTVQLRSFPGNTSQKFGPDICESKGKGVDISEMVTVVGLVLFPINIINLKNSDSCNVLFGLQVGFETAQYIYTCEVVEDISFLRLTFL